MSRPTQLDVPLRVVFVACVLSLAPVVSTWAQESIQQSPARLSGPLPVEEVLVTGEHPGPGLWKVSKGDHVLWILGTHAPLPKGLLWRSHEVELAISESQEILGDYSASLSIRGANPFESKGKTLRSQLPRKTYRQWLAMKKKYIGDNREVEEALPVVAALALRSRAFARSGLTNSDPAWNEIYRLAKDYRIPVDVSHQLVKAINIDAIDTASNQRNGVEFLARTMANLEADLRTARARANAWALGDIDTLRSSASADNESALLYTNSWPFLSDAEVQSLRAETDKRWVDAAAAALNRNRTTFAALPIFLLLQSDGLLSQLSARGLTEEPVTEELYLARLRCVPC